MNGNSVLLFLILWPMCGGIISYFSGRFNRRVRDYIADAVCLIELACVIACYNFMGSELVIPGVCGLGMKFKLDGFRFIYAFIIAFMWSATTIFSREYLQHHHNRNRYYLYVLMTFGSIMGVFLSGDLYTTFMFFEMMSLFSYVMVVQDETPDAQRAAQTYLAIAIIGGLITLTGLILLYAQAGTLDIDELAKFRPADKGALYISGFLVFVGFAAKAAIFPSHIWLPTAHTAAPAPSSALLSGLLTKSGLFGILVLSSGIFIHDSYWGFMLLILAKITMVLGAVLAVFSILCATKTDLFSQEILYHMRCRKEDIMVKINIRHREYLQDQGEVLDDMIYQMGLLEDTAEAQQSNALRAQHVLVERTLRKARSYISNILRRY